MGMNAAATIERRAFDAAIFDLDGVLTDTAHLHAAAWKATFDELLRKRAEREGVPFKPFDGSADYLAYVDGRTRADGVRTFLAARGITLSEGSNNDPPEAQTVTAVGEHKARIFLEKLQHGIDPSPGAEALLERLRQVGFKIAVASASKNCAAVLRATRLDRLVDARTDGVDAEQFGFKGKPDPALFLEAARRLGVDPSRIVVFEDALAGVEAGRLGNFGCVVAIDRDRQHYALRRRGADKIIQSLQQVEIVG